MAEYLFNARKISGFRADSAATSSWEEGNPVHIGTKKILKSLGIDCSAKRARKITRADYDNYDYIIGMDEQNRRDLVSFFGGDPKKKISLLLDYTGSPRDVADPWYTGDFETTYKDINAGIDAFLSKENGKPNGTR